MNDDGLLAEQRAYYQARAPEYDEWWQRRGRFELSPELAEEWDREVAQVAAALETFGATGDVLELAGGTGWWTARLARTAGHLLLLALSRAAATIFGLLVLGAVLSRTGGRVFLIDNRNESHPPREIADPYVLRRDSDLELRRLHDGREFQVVEVFYEPEELQSLLGDEGWTARLDATRWFIFGEACLADARQPARPNAAPNAR